MLNNLNYIKYINIAIHVYISRTIINTIIIKNYINVLAFDDSEKVLDRIAKILNGEKAPQLTMEHKKLLNPFMDNNGLERFKSVVTDIIVNKKGFSKEQMPVNNP